MVKTINSNNLREHFHYIALCFACWNKQSVAYGWVLSRMERLTCNDYVDCLSSMMLWNVGILDNTLLHEKEIGKGQSVLLWPFFLSVASRDYLSYVAITMGRFLLLQLPTSRPTAVSNWAEPLPSI